MALKNALTIFDEFAVMNWGQLYSLKGNKKTTENENVLKDMQKNCQGIENDVRINYKISMYILYFHP